MLLDHYPEPRCFAIQETPESRYWIVRRRDTCDSVNRKQVLKLAVHIEGPAQIMKTKNAYLAFILNFIVPGLGMAYLRDWKKAVVNFVLVAGLGYILHFKIGEPPLWITLFIGIASGAWAYLETDELKSKQSRNPEEKV